VLCHFFATFEGWPARRAPLDDEHEPHVCQEPMLNEDLKDLFARRPFRPFTIHLACGRAVLVDQPERMSISPDETRMNVFTGDGHFHLLDVSQIADLEVA